MLVKTIRVEEAVGRVLCHDLTKIVRGQYKGARFKKGQVIKEEDVEELLKMGKEQVYVLELEPGDLHEDEAGLRLGRAAAGPGVEISAPKESRVNLYASIDGLLKVNVPALEAINCLEDVVFATLPNNSVVKKGDLLAGTKVVPLVTREGTIKEVESICRQAGWVLKVIPFKKLNAGLIITGNEVFKKRIRDDFGPVMAGKLESFGSGVKFLAYAPDDAAEIADRIKDMAVGGAQLIIVTGGMSVDPDDVTPLAIKMSGAEVEKYGAPVLPGAMFMLAYLGDIPVLGMPACGMFFKTTVLDLILPRLLCGERVKRSDIVSLAHGGLCQGCERCRFPNCTFGKGSAFTLRREM